jgi:hypothetical protein
VRVGPLREREQPFVEPAFDGSSPGRHFLVVFRHSVLPDEIAMVIMEARPAGG